MYLKYLSSSTHLLGPCLVCIYFIMCVCVLCVCLCICDRIRQKGLIRAVINIEKSCFEILITMYLKNAWCFVYTILHQSIVIQGNSVGVLFNGLLAELPAILDSFSQVIT